MTTTQWTQTIDGIAAYQQQTRERIIATAQAEGWTTLRLVKVLDALQLAPLPRAK